MRRLSRVLLIAALACLVIGLALLANTLRQRSRQLVVPAAPAFAFDVNAAAARLAAVVKLRTISYEAASPESEAAFPVLHRYLETAYPHLHATLTRETVGRYSLLYRWEGADPTAAPALLMAHQDVVPVAPGTEAAWHADPFGGEIRDGYVWGRGTWDDKGNLIAILEAVEHLAATGFQPRRTLYLAFGHDEENGGSEGAARIAQLLRSRHVHLAFVLDEGLVVTEGILPGLRPPAALIGVGEKGSATLKLTATATPGHSSMPAPRTAIGALAGALARLERAPMRAMIRGAAADMFDTLAPEMAFPSRLLLTNRWLFGRLIEHSLVAAPTTAALLRTTTAETMIQGGNKQNVLPGSAEAWVNFRLLPGDSVDDVAKHVRRVIADDDIRIDFLPDATPASRLAPVRGEGYRLVERAMRALEPDVVITPGLVVGATDARHFEDLADGVYRFSPVHVGPADVSRFHGTDERISIANFAGLIRFYEQVIRTSDPPVP